MANVTLKVKIGSIAVEVTGDPSYAESKLEELLNKYSKHHSSPSNQESSSNSQTKSNNKPKSPSEFIRTLTAKTQFDRALGLGYYLERYNQ